MRFYSKIIKVHRFIICFGIVKIYTFFKNRQIDILIEFLTDKITVIKSSIKLLLCVFIILNFILNNEYYGIFR
ncbi:MAG: hypothetical protein CMH15_02595 [Mesonia sp.]|nr:hypothetical protein [Mesonia sp.]MAQ39933.1 hypothetical protein [Mesonia sp.]